MEKVLYRSGEGVTVEANDFSYVDFVNADGVSISDHKAASTELTFTKTDAFTENTASLRVPHGDYHNSLLFKVLIILKDLRIVLAHLDNLSI